MNTQETVSNESEGAAAQVTNKQNPENAIEKKLENSNIKCRCLTQEQAYLEIFTPKHGGGIEDITRTHWVPEKKIRSRYFAINATGPPPTEENIQGSIGARLI